jgi:hypothetical protein
MAPAVATGVPGVERHPKADAAIPSKRLDGGRAQAVSKDLDDVQRLGRLVVLGMTRSPRSSPETR